MRGLIAAGLMSLLCGVAVNAAQAPASAAQDAALATMKATVQTALQADAGWWRALDTAERDRVGLALVRDVYSNLGRGGEGDMARALQVLDALAAYAPQTPMRAGAEGLYLKALERTDTAAAQGRLEHLSSDTSSAMATMVANKRFALSLKTDPIEFRFPDLDGRMIDMADYRGKVVFLDFWATWCKPCMAEMPNVKAVSAKYRDQGFEVIGVTDDIPYDPENPRPNQFTMERLKAFLEKEGMTWPQLWDRREKPDPGTKLLLRQFDVGSLPTTFLFGPDGRLYSKDNHGAKLEQNVRTLLGLEPARD